MFVISNSKSFLPQILKVVSPLGEKLIYFSPLAFVIRKNHDFETSEFKLCSFRAFQQYLTDKNSSHGRRAASFFQFSADNFQMYLRTFLWRGGRFGGYNFSTYENVCIWNNYCVSDIFSMEVKFSWGIKTPAWAKNPAGGHKQDSKMCWVLLLTSYHSMFLYKHT